jgi:cobalt/nickel transport system ATP-binding protein
MDKMNETIFEIRDAGYVYPDGHLGIGWVSFDIRRGERVALAGANASGKSTLLCLLDGLYFPTSGEVRAFGETLTEKLLSGGEFAREFRKRVGFVFQNSDAQLFCSTVQEELAFGPLQLGQPDAEVWERIERILDLCDLTEHRSRPPHSLSIGEKKRVALASVLTTDPSVLLLDEPTAGLDPRSQVWLIDLLIQLGREGKTLVIATHDLHAIEYLADRVIVLNEHHGISAIGPPDQILSNRDLLISANLIHEHVHAHDRVLHVHEHVHSGEHEHSH